MTDSMITYILAGVGETLSYTVTGVFFGFILGSILSIFRVVHILPLRYFASIYISIFRGTPLLIQLSIIYYIPPTLTNMLGYDLSYNISVFEAGILAFSLNSSAYVAEIIRSGIKAIDIGQFEAAKALSIPYTKMMKDIIMPQAIRNVVPALANESVNLLKETAIIAVIGGADIMRRSQEISAAQYDYFGPLMIAAASYYVLVLVFSAMAKYIEFRFDRQI